MKIIAKTNDTTFLVEVTQYELNSISGRKCGGYNSSDYYNVGQSFEPDKIWRYLSEILKSKKQLSDSARNLRSMADMIESIPIPTEESMIQ